MDPPGFGRDRRPLVCERHPRRAFARRPPPDSSAALPPPLAADRLATNRIRIVAEWFRRGWAGTAVVRWGPSLAPGENAASAGAPPASPTPPGDGLTRGAVGTGRGDGSLS